MYFLANVLLHFVVWNETFWPLRAPPAVLKMCVVLHSGAEKRRLGRGIYGFRAKWACWHANGASLDVRWAALRKMRNNAFFSCGVWRGKSEGIGFGKSVHHFFGGMVTGRLWRKFCLLLFCLRHKERAHQARPGVRTTLAAQQSRLADWVQPALGCAIEAKSFPHKDSSRKSRHCRTSWAS